VSRMLSVEEDSTVNCAENISDTSAPEILLLDKGRVSGFESASAMQAPIIIAQNTAHNRNVYELILASAI
jgi:hypothetical protein